MVVAEDGVVVGADAVVGAAAVVGGLVTAVVTGVVTGVVTVVLGTRVEVTGTVVVDVDGV